jgi:ribonuclease-3
MIILLLNYQTMHQLLKFRDHQLLLRALTHRSYVNENPDVEQDNERLEFLGDALLNFLSAEYFYQHPEYPEMGEDEMTRRRAVLVEEKQLAKFALDIGLDTEMQLGKGAIKDGGYQNTNLLSSTFEAVVAAYYLDNNSEINAVRQCIIPLFESLFVTPIKTRSYLDPKNQLQEIIQSRGIVQPPRYQTVRVGGSDHDPEFLAKVLIQNKKLGEGRGKTKKEAEKEAANNALEKLFGSD